MSVPPTDCAGLQEACDAKNENCVLHNLGGEGASDIKYLRDKLDEKQPEEALSMVVEIGAANLLGDLADRVIAV